MAIKNIALINSANQVVNHVVADVDDESVIAALYEFWDCVRYVETKEEDFVELYESNDLWTTHTEETGFVAPTVEEPIKKVKKSDLPADSLLLEENASNRPAGWVFPDKLELVED